MHSRELALCMFRKVEVLLLVNLRSAFRSHADDGEALRLVVPVTGSGSDDRLLNLTAKLAQKKAAKVTLIYVVEVDQSLPLDADLPTDSTHGEAVLQEARNAVIGLAESKNNTVNTELLQARSAGPAIVDESIVQDATCILMSARLMKRHGKITYGETVDYVMKNAQCEVIVIRHAMPDAILEELEMDIE